MTRSLYTKFLLGYLVFGLLGFIFIATMSSEITYQYLLEEKSDSLYDEANLLASTYSDIYQGKNISLSTANPQLQAVATYLKAQAWVINQKGSVVAETSPASHIGTSIDGFDPTAAGNRSYMTGRFFGMFDKDMLSVIAPITGNFNTYGYVVIHMPIEQIVHGKDRILNIVYRFEENRDKTAVFDRDRDHEMAKKVAEETIVLLKNEDNLLPLSEKEDIAFIGKYARKPRYQGGGSSHINSHKVTGAWDCVKDWGNITFAEGYADDADVVDEAMIAEAVANASKAKAAVIFAGLPDAFESEGFDRAHMGMPGCQNELIERVAAVQPNTIVVLHNGSPVEMPWADKVKGIVEAYLGGQAVGAATVDILFGKVNPSAKLPESFPYKLEDNPSYLYYLGEGDRVEYREGVFVGYRYYDTKKMEVRFPFGFGLSYTSYEYSNLKVSADHIKDTDVLEVSVDVTNTGGMAGKEVVQLYVSDVESTVIRPVKELKGFEKVELAPGETKTVTFTLDKRAFAYWNTQLHDWHVETGEFRILIGKSSRDIQLEAAVTVESTVKVPVHYTMDTTFGDLMKDEKAMQIIAPMMQLNIGGQQNESDAAAEAISREMMEAMMKYMPIRGILSFAGGKVTLEQLTGLLDQLNAAQ